MADKYLNNTGLQYFFNRIKTIFALKSEIPDSTSDLTNDSGFITSASLPTKVSDLTNDTGFITNAVNDLINYYKKTETYSKSEVDTLIGQISTVNFEIVTTLPTQDISTSTIYLLANGTSEYENIYDEYVYINNAWEKIGSTAIDLTSYWTSTSGLNNSLIAITTAEIDTITQ